MLATAPAGARARRRAPRTVLSGLMTLLPLAAFARPAAAQSAPTLEQRLDSIAALGVQKQLTAGSVIAVVKDDQLLLHRSYGKADLEWDVPMPLDALFEIGSLTKQFTAVAVLQLRDEGKLGLDDELTKWLPDFDTRGHRVTLRHLLDHTSGIVGLTEIPGFEHLVTSERFPRDSAYALINRTPFQFGPGAEQNYSNSGFFLLGMVIEKASGMTYEEYVEKKIFGPLGMSRSMYCDSGENLPRRAHGYMTRPPLIRRARSNVHTWPYAAGSLCSTAGDIMTWLRALHGGKVLSPKSYAEFITPAKLNDGTPLRYSMGMQVGPDPAGIHYIGHGGSIPGFHVEAGWYPESKLAVVVMHNTNGPLDPQEIVTAIAEEVTGRREPAPKRFTGDAKPLVGKYVGHGREEDMTVEVVETPQGPAFSRDGSPPRPFPWVEGYTFRAGALLLTFRRANGESGPVTELRYSMPGGHYILKKQ